MNNNLQYSKQLRENEAARILNVSREKLRSDRWRGIGAPFRRYGRSIRYDMEELQEWMKAQSSTAGAAK